MIAALPQTIQDAIVVTRAFGVRYLWVDALCTIQAYEQMSGDWQRELPNVGKIYSHSLITIAASSAEDSSMGLFRRTTAAGWPVRDYHLSDNECSHNTDGSSPKPDAEF